MNWSLYLDALVAILAVGGVSWVVSVFRNDVSFVDSLWSLFFVIAAVVFAADAADLSARAWLVLALVTVWALRLSVYITARNWGRPEDHRYASMRENHEPGFAVKSLYIVFGLQGVLAWIVALPLLPAVTADAALTPLDALAALLWLVGIVFEAGGDYQLARFRRDPGNEGRVLDTGLWRYTRHPNYFGDFCIWWAFYLFAAAAGAWWTIVSPLVMSFLLLKVSGVTMLESTITDRRPAYADYIRRTNAFFPGTPRGTAALFVAGLLAFGLAAPAPASETARWEFDVYLNDRKVGKHVFNVTEAGGQRRVRSEADFVYRILFIPAYRYAHSNTERWENGCLIAFAAETNANGERIEVSGSATSDGFRVDTGTEAVELPRCVMTFAYWNLEFLRESRLLNPQTGEYVDVAVEEIGSEILEVRGKPVPATRFRLTAYEVDLTLWYSFEDEWLALESVAEGGHVIRYELS